MRTGGASLVCEQRARTHFSVSQTQSSAERRSLRHENAYGMKLEERSLAIAAKFRLVPTLKSLTLSHHNAALP